MDFNEKTSVTIDEKTSRKRFLFPPDIFEITGKPYGRINKAMLRGNIIRELERCDKKKR